MLYKLATKQNIADDYNKHPYQTDKSFGHACQWKKTKRTDVNSSLYCTKLSEWNTGQKLTKNKIGTVVDGWADRVGGGGRSWWPTNNQDRVKPLGGVQVQERSYTLA